MSEEERTPEPLRCATPVERAEMVRVPALLMVWLPPTVRPGKVPTAVIFEYEPTERSELVINDEETTPLLSRCAIPVERPERVVVPDTVSELRVPTPVMLPY